MLFLPLCQNNTDNLFRDTKARLMLKLPQDNPLLKKKLVTLAPVK